LDFWYFEIKMKMREFLVTNDDDDDDDIFQMLLPSDVNATQCMGTDIASHLIDEGTH